MRSMPSGRPGRGCARALGRRLPSFLIATGCVWFAIRYVGDLDLRQVGGTIRAVPAGTWLAALGATLLSFLAAGQYDVLFHRWLGTGVARRRAALSGAAAIALSQTLGFGLATGTIVRWRALPELALGDALKLTNYVSFSFMAALGLLTALALSLPGAGATGPSLFGLAAVLAVVLALVLSLAGPGILPFPLPPIRLAIRLTLLALADTGLAALGLWLLLPAGMHPDPAAFYAAYLLALGAGLVSGAPGGVGPFELCLVALLPMVPEAGFLGAVLAFRLVYYALPACLAVPLLIRPRPRPRQASVPRAVPARNALRRAEAHLGFRPGHGFIAAPDGVSHVAEATQVLVAIGDPATGGAMTPALMARLGRMAAERGLWPALYKCGARSAARARGAGWSVIPVSDETWIEPAGFTTAGPDRRQLRRKLRQARQAGVAVEEARQLPLSDMARVARDWAARAGGERGFSMGRFDPDFVAFQRCYLARFGGELVAFATFHTVPGEWALDLMRSAEGVPDGTMHALVARAIEDAAAAGIDRLSLAAMALEAPSGALALVARRREAAGLRRFKTSFAPRTRRLYVAAPGPAVLALAGVDILIRIARPPERRGSEMSGEIGSEAGIDPGIRPPFRAGPGWFLSRTRTAAAAPPRPGA